jgi:hypothetical protein
MPYRGTTDEEFSNRYYLRGAPPADDAAWLTLVTDLANLEAICFSPPVKTVRAYGYNDDAANAQSVFSHDWLATGDWPNGSLTDSGPLMAGDQAGLIEWKTNRKNSRGKFIYLRKYFHHGHVDATNTDNLGTQTALNYRQFAHELDPAGTAFHGGIRSRTHADPLLFIGEYSYVTTRTLKRRGKRPLAHA